MTSEVRELAPCTKSIEYGEYTKRLVDGIRIDSIHVWRIAVIRHGHFVLIDYLMYLRNGARWMHVIGWMMSRDMRRA